MKKLVLLLPLLLIISACSRSQATADAQVVGTEVEQTGTTIANVPTNFNQSQSDKTTTAFVNQQLASTAQTVSRSMQRLAQVEVANNPKVHMPSPMNPLAHQDTAALAQTASVDWTGPTEPLLKKIATACHYQLQVLGTSPSIPALVSINVKNQKLSEILRNVGYQIHNAASITLYPKRQVIELRYVSP